MTLEQDKKKLDDYYNGEGEFDIDAFKRVVITNLAQVGVFRRRKIMGYTWDEIRDKIYNPPIPPAFCSRIINFMYTYSSYFKKLVDYYSNMPVYNWTVDTEIINEGFYKQRPLSVRKNFVNFTSKVNSLKLEYELKGIMNRMVLEDACFGFLCEETDTPFIFYFPHEICYINKQVNGMWGFKINVNIVPNLSIFPPELLAIIEENIDSAGFVDIPFEKGICFKYFNESPIITPPLLALVKDIFDIDFYKELAKAKTEQEAYRMIIHTLPTVDGKMSMGDKIVAPFVETTRAVVPESIGVIATPFETSVAQFKSDQSERDKVKDATDQFYNDAGVSPAIAGGGTSGSEVKLSIRADESDIFRIYRQLEHYVNTLMEIRGYGIFTSYRFVFRLLDMTNFSVEDYTTRQLQMAQVSIPNKLELCASLGITPAKLLGNQRIENEILELGVGWNPLKTSYTSSSEDITDEGGRPVQEEVTEVTEVGRENDSNDPDNRI